MNSISYSQSTTKRSIPGQVAKVAILLGLSLGLLWFAIDFPAYLIFESQSAGWMLWFSYANDLILPFALYFIICLGERWLRAWQGRALLAFAIPILLEIRQGLNVLFPVGRYVGSFDLLDIVVYAIGVGLAVIVDRKVFARMLRFW
jgi:hypothetical protein